MLKQSCRLGTAALLCATVSLFANCKAREFNGEGDVNAVAAPTARPIRYVEPQKIAFTNYTEEDCTKLNGTWAGDGMCDNVPSNNTIELIKTGTGFSVVKVDTAATNGSGCNFSGKSKSVKGNVIVAVDTNTPTCEVTLKLLDSTTAQVTASTSDCIANVCGIGGSLTINAAKLVK